MASALLACSLAVKLLSESDVSFSAVMSVQLSLVKSIVEIFESPVKEPLRVLVLLSLEVILSVSLFICWSSDKISLTLESRNEQSTNFIYTRYPSKIKYYLKVNYQRIKHFLEICNINIFNTV